MSLNPMKPSIMRVDPSRSYTDRGHSYSRAKIWMEQEKNNLSPVSFSHLLPVSPVSQTNPEPRWQEDQLHGGQSPGPRGQQKMGGRKGGKKNEY